MFPLLLAVSVTGTFAWACISTLAVGACLGYIYFKVDSRIEELRKDAFRASSQLQKMGFEWIDDVLECVASGDKSGAFKALKELRKKMDNGEEFHRHMQGVYLKGLPYLMDNDLDFCAKVVRTVTDKQKLEQIEAEEKKRQEEALKKLEKEEAERQRKAEEALAEKEATPTKK